MMIFHENQHLQIQGRSLCPNAQRTYQRALWNTFQGKIKTLTPSHYLRQIRSVSLYDDVMTSLVASKILIFMKTGMIFGIRPKKKSYNAVHHFLKGNTSTLTPYHYFGQNMGIVTSWYPLKQPKYWFQKKKLRFFEISAKKCPKTPWTTQLREKEAIRPPSIIEAKTWSLRSHDPLW